MRYFALTIALCLPFPAYAGNIKDSDLITSNTFFLPPSTAKTVFIQARNSSDNQGVSLSDLDARLTAKGYQIIQDPSAAHYVVLANIVYCNITKPDMPVEAMVASGYGSAFNSAMGAMQGLTSMASMAGPYGAMGGAAASMGLSAIQGIGDLFSSSSIGSQDAGRRELCLRRGCADYRAESRTAPKRNENRNRGGARRVPNQTGCRCASEKTG